MLSDCRCTECPARAPRWWHWALWRLMPWTRQASDGWTCRIEDCRLHNRMLRNIRWLRGE